MQVPDPRLSPESLPSIRSIRGIVALESSPLAGLFSMPGPGVGWAEASDAVFTELLEAIRTLRLLPGSLLVEAEIAAAARVSRASVEEAIARLTAAGLVTSVPHVGTKVARIRWREVGRELRLRESLETYAFDAACGARARDTTRMHDLIEVQQGAAESRDIRAFMAACEQFHDELVALADAANGRMAVRLPHFHLDRAHRLTRPDQDIFTTVIDEHVVIADAVESGNAASGRRTLLRHLRRLRQFSDEAYAAYPAYFID
ncbi:GntR family transcriptional regulator [Nocardioides baekrokdamisoli]|uniref:GntR family transcriptional regulator n=1 Tax=Nocardioides baekrokdamisoli TaxID=1804624 RepID=A0A3G9J4L6_9ACTN|nr:GntR family transcriptional regulator [Nocardioides baekrokdamisoli]BBH18598.1 GntR family transcriptional regulator [Nocardioides baekrokdamisoli]